ncbi:MAG: hypothetical protein ABI618_01035 [Nitrospirota bacterium]
MKRLTPPMPGYKNFHPVQRTLAGIEGMAMIKKGQMNASEGKKKSSDEKFYALPGQGTQSYGILFVPVNIGDQTVGSSGPEFPGTGKR